MVKILRCSKPYSVCFYPGKILYRSNLNNRAFHCNIFLHETTDTYKVRSENKKNDAWFPFHLGINLTFFIEVTGSSFKLK